MQAKQNLKSGKFASRLGMTRLDVFPVHKAAPTIIVSLQQPASATAECSELYPHRLRQSRNLGFCPLGARIQNLGGGSHDLRLGLRNRANEGRAVLEQPWTIARII
jgi:hypothetical protein